MVVLDTSARTVRMAAKTLRTASRDYSKLKRRIERGKLASDDARISTLLEILTTEKADAQTVLRSADRTGLDTTELKAAIDEAKGLIDGASAENESGLATVDETSGDVRPSGSVSQAAVT